ncbi:MAG TPA: transglycosylase SLT domain-containing protein [Thermoleophilaceae bacterium]|nr:transglycosylase SLT domain-containing protein [Thermoleophilaceae bacterium]
MTVRRRLAEEHGQALLLLLGVTAVAIAGTLVLVAFGEALGGKSRHQRAADLAAVSAAHRMREDYPRLFEPAMLETGVPNPRHLSTAMYLEHARSVAVRAGARNGVPLDAADVDFPGDDFAPTRVRVRVRGHVDVRVSGGSRKREVDLRASATAELSPAAGAALPTNASGGGYAGPLAYRMGKPMRPDVAPAFDRLAAAARADGVALTITSAYRSDAEQARLFAAHPDPKWVAPPGKSLHRLGTELDLGPPSAYGWLAANAPSFGFTQRYSWEPWHWGYTRAAGSASLGYGSAIRDGRSAVPSFVPREYVDEISRASQRWNVGAALLSAQIYAESNFNPNAGSPAGAQGIAQFMPGTARSYGLSDPFDPAAAIDAQAHLMHDLLRQLGSVPLALAGYNAGPAPVQACGCVPPYPETQAYVAKILGILGGAGDMTGATFEVRLVE